MRTWIGCLVMAACAGEPSALSGDGVRVASEDALFHQDPRWLGADGAYTIDLNDGRVLWLFGDSFIATSAADSRAASTLVRNSIAVMTGHDPVTATMQFAWTDGSPPDSFFAEVGSSWSWPSDGARVGDGPLLVFLSQQVATPNEGLGFAAVGYRAVRVIDPSGAPSAWTIADVPTSPAPFDATASVACSTIDGDELVALVVAGDGHDGRLARWPLTAIGDGDLSAPEWWDGAEWSSTAMSPAIAIGGGATECSLSQVGDVWVHVASGGFGATTVAIRTAPELTGPWSDPLDVFTPPESAAPNAFVYAAKAHPTLVTHTPGATLVITYANNSFTFSDLLDPANASTLYWPHVAELALH